MLPLKMQRDLDSLFGNGQQVHLAFRKKMRAEEQAGMLTVLQLHVFRLLARCVRTLKLKYTKLCI